MRKVDDGEKKKKRRKEEEKNDVFSGHYVIASSLPPERLRPNDDRWNAARSCQFLPHSATSWIPNEASLSLQDGDTKWLYCQAQPKPKPKLGAEIPLISKLS